MKAKIFMLGISLFLVGFSIKKTYYNKENQLIKGIWISQEDPNWKIEFKANGKCYWFYAGKLDDVYNYSISDNSPLCGKKVPTGNKFSYLKLVNTVDSSDLYCYEINTLNNEYLTLMFIGEKNMKLMVFKKQVLMNPRPDELPDLDDGQH